jgi:peptidyl-prolyl cis-trans isomerase B (cyclophilin B)
MFLIAFLTATTFVAGCQSVKGLSSSGQVEEVAVFQTTKGTFVLEFYPDKAPETVKNFKKLVKAGFYDGLTFHRYVPEFVIQGGDPKGDGTGGPGYTIPDEFNDLKHAPGMVGMAHKGIPNSAGSQFYICLPPDKGQFSHLDGKYTLFARVVEGMNVVEKLRQGDKIIEARLRPRRVRDSGGPKS